MPEYDNVEVYIARCSFCSEQGPYGSNEGEAGNGAMKEGWVVQKGKWICKGCLREIVLLAKTKLSDPMPEPVMPKYVPDPSDARYRHGIAD